MLIGLSLRDVVLIERLDLAIGPGLTALTGETGAGKSILLEALGLATGARADAGLVRAGATQAVAMAIFALPMDHPAFAYLEDKGLAYRRDEDLVLRRLVNADGRSRAFVNDQATGVGTLKDLAGLLLEIHGQHQTVGLLDARTHRHLLDDFGQVSGAACAEAWSAWRAQLERLSGLRDAEARSAAEIEELRVQLAELDRLEPRAGEELELAQSRAVLGFAEKALGDVSAASQAIGGARTTDRLTQAWRALERARDRALQAGTAPDSAPLERLTRAADALDRAIGDLQEAAASIELASRAFDFEPDQLERTEERLFALRAAARKYATAVDALPALRLRLADRLHQLEDREAVLAEAMLTETAARLMFELVAERLSAERLAAGDRLTRAVEAELGPLKLEKAKFRVAIEPLGLDRAGPAGLDKVRLEIATHPLAPFGPIEFIASGGELARLALALKAALAGRPGPQPLMIFDEVDQGVGGAVADAVGVRLQRLAQTGQVLVVTHSPQVAARADSHWRIAKADDRGRFSTSVQTLTGKAREEEIARMLSGAEITGAARAAARALIEA